jgi:hypothetical protein
MAIKLSQFTVTVVVGGEGGEFGITFAGQTMTVGICNFSFVINWGFLRRSTAVWVRAFNKSASENTLGDITPSLREASEKTAPTVSTGAPTVRVFLVVDCASVRLNVFFG